MPPTAPQILKRRHIDGDAVGLKRPNDRQEGRLKFWLIKNCAAQAALNGGFERADSP